ncbi:MAG: response regulator [Cytophagales bacterium]|nr:response regulator [Cytophagales bacterium]MDW8384022.1 response regulator [Flammeovirgaceae bacterium]
MMTFSPILYRIYVLEDNRAETLVLKLAFSKMENVIIEYFNSATSFLQRLEQEIPDIVLMDYLLPDADGIEVIRKIKSKSDDIRIVVVSSQEQVSVIAEAQSEEIDNFIVKSPSCIRYLRKVMNDLIILVNYYKSIKGTW